MFDLILKETFVTLYMVLTTTIFGYAFGLPLGIILTITDPDGIKPNKYVYKVLDVIINIARSIPFLILLMLIIPITKFIVGKSYGASATVVPLVFSAVPFIARVVETSLKETDKGVIEAAQAMGASSIQIITNVLLVESRVSLINSLSIVMGTIVGYSAMAGIVGGGGLGDIAIQYGYYRYDFNIMIVTVIVLILLVQIFQTTGNFVAKKIDRRLTK